MLGRHAGTLLPVGLHARVPPDMSAYFPHLRGSISVGNSCKKALTCRSLRKGGTRNDYRQAERLLYTVESMGDILDVGRTTVYGLIASGELQSIKIGRSRRVPADALEAYVAKLVDTRRTTQPEMSQQVRAGPTRKPARSPSCRQAAKGRVHYPTR